jgi:hypothetical protein
VWRKVSRTVRKGGGGSESRGMRRENRGRVEETDLEARKPFLAELRGSNCSALHVFFLIGIVFLDGGKEQHRCVFRSSSEESSPEHTQLLLSALSNCLSFSNYLQYFICNPSIVAGSL